MDLDISVIITLYNKADTVSRAIRSALSQDIDVEAILVDDGSTHGSASVVKSFGVVVK
jgi:glycosyltransferase involved in cell wall biosynthesis